MILDQKIQVKITKKNLDYYLKYYPLIKLGDIIDVDILNLQKGSNLKINVKCDLCDEIRFIKYQAYNKNINSSKEYSIYTCDRCSHIKLKKTNLEKYGVEYYSKHPDRNEKVKNTSIKKYGVDHFSKSILYKEKVSNTNLEKFGVENPFMNKELIKSKFIEKYGVDHPSKLDWVRDKTKKTNLEKYGSENILSVPEIREKIIETNLEKYGNNIPMKSETIRLKNMLKISTHPNYINYIKNGISLFKCGEGHNFEISTDLFHNRLRSKIDLCTICYPISSHSSIKQIELFNFIKSVYKSEIIENYKDELEIDIYLPDLKLGFEFNGLYWHSDEWKDKNYHSYKSSYFLNKGIKIVHIWEDDWMNKQAIVKSMILNKLNKNSCKIYARDCSIKEISNSEHVNFLNENHIQGFVGSSIKLGLYYNNELVSLMCFDKFEGRKKMKEGEWNLSRFCNKINTSVVGGASKLLSYFIRNNNPTRIVSYADKDWSSGDLYYKLGFINLGESKPDYKYIVEGVRRHKQNYKKNEKVIKEIYSRIWDCGKIKFEKNLYTI